MLQFETPLVLLLLLALPLLWRKRKLSAAIPFPGVIHFANEPPTGVRQRFLRYLPVVRMAVLALLIVALAQPMLHPEPVRTITDGRAIEIVVDRSNSMSTVDMNYDGAEMTRLDAVKRVTYDFIFGGRSADLKGRPTDMIGLICFAADPITLSPLTFSHGALAHSIKNLEVAGTLAEDGTAIGDALALAAARLQASVRASKQQIKSKIIVLITDGENNLGASTPEQAAQLAKQWGIKIYAIIISTETVKTEREQQVGYGMSSLAESTGGFAWTVRNGSALRAIHQEIDRLEPTRLDVTKRTDGGRALTWILAVALVLIVADLVLRNTWLRKVPA